MVKLDFMNIAVLPVTAPEFLAWERKEERKHEYFEGEVIDFAGASLAHNHIVANLLKEVGNRLEDKPCQILPSDMRVTTPNETVYMYPDAVIVCGQPEMADSKFDTLKNPRVIFEVLSPSTSYHDRVRKFAFYKLIPSFREYVLIDSQQLYAEVGRRQEDGSWDFESTVDPHGYLRVPSVKAFIPLRAIYRNVFPEPVL